MHFGKTRTIRRPAGWRIFALLLFWANAVLAFGASPAASKVLIVVGAAGDSEYGTNFARQAALWRDVAARGAAEVATIGLDSGPTNDLELLRVALTAEPSEGPPYWLILIGHGSYDGRQARFNLRGPDISATNLATWLKPLRRPLAVVNTTSSSAPFINALSGTNRVIVTATRNGAEQNYARFGGYLAQAIGDPAADLDKDGQVSLLEAFLLASRQVAEFYRLENRIATEHALLDDNADGLGTPADWFKGLRATKRAKDHASLDGLLAAQFCLVPSPADATLSSEARAKRDQLETAVRELRNRKEKMPEDAYYSALEALLLELARLRFPNP